MLTVKRVCSYGSRPWAIVDSDGYHVEGPPRRLDHGVLGYLVSYRPIYYRLKREAEAARVELERTQENDQ